MMRGHTLIEVVIAIALTGGVVAAIESGFQQREIADAAYRYQGQYDRKEKTIVGANKYEMKDTLKPELLKIHQDIEDRQLERLKELRRTRDANRVESALEAMREAAKGEQNLIPLMLEAARAYATVGEISAALIPVFGTYRETSVI